MAAKNDINKHYLMAVKWQEFLGEGNIPSWAKFSTEGLLVHFLFNSHAESSILKA